jgi:alpha,alpha-trehalose phosphorylase
MGGVWMIFVYGFAGMRDYDGRLSFRPRIPHSLERLRFQLMFNSQVLEIDASRPNTRYTLRTGSGLVITHEEYDIQLTPETPSCVQPNWTADILHKPPKTSPH